jgi:hypothetical protein
MAVHAAPETVAAAVSPPSPVAVGRVAAGAHTNLPRWDDTPPQADPGGRFFAVLSFGEPARPVADNWMAQIHRMHTGSWRLHDDTADEAVVDKLRQRLTRATVGWRLMVAGPEADVLAVSAEALRHGTLPAEIRAHATSTMRRRVQCVHCGTVADVDAQPGALLPCAGCGHHLLVHHHLSRRLAAHLGFRADAETPAP